MDPDVPTGPELRPPLSDHGQPPGRVLATYKRPNWTPDEAREMGRRGAEARAAKRSAERRELQSFRSQARTRSDDGAYIANGPDFVLDQAWRALAVQIKRLATASGPKPANVKEAAEMIKQLLDAITALQDLATKKRVLDARAGTEGNPASLLRALLEARGESE